MTAMLPVIAAGLMDWLEYVAVTLPPEIVNILKFTLLAAGTPSRMVPPAEGIASPNPLCEAPLVALKAILFPSGTSVPLMSRMLVMVMVLVPGTVGEEVTMGGLAVMVAECATNWRSSKATNRNVPTNFDPSVKEVVTV